MQKGSNNTNVDVTHHVRWQIPRASLSSGSRSMYSSTDSIQGSFDKCSNKNNILRQQQQRKNARRESYSTGSDTKGNKLAERRDEGPYSMPSSAGSSLSSTMQQNKKFSRRKFSESLITSQHIDKLSSVVAEGVHVSSSRSSSQGSSSNSLHSASSLLLSVQNLEKFTRMTSNQSRINNLRNLPRNGCDNENNKLQSASKATAYDNHMILDMNKLINNNQSVNGNNDISHNEVDEFFDKENLRHNLCKPKEQDQLSIASSTHFTLVNGCGRSNLKLQNSFCRHGRQITILIVTMTTFFIIGILFALYLMDRRAKAMPAYHQ